MSTSTQRWYHKWAWYDPRETKEERRLLLKQDFMILTFGCLTFFTKFLDLQAFQNAYVTGMKEDVGMEGNDLQYTTGVFQAGYCAMMIPANFLLTRVSPNIFIPICEAIWGCLTLATAFADTVSHVYAIRFLSGVFETVAYPGVIYCIGSWYKRSEISRRLSLFYIAGPLGTMFAGYFQSACYTNLDGVHGMAGWRWLFIVDGNEAPQVKLTKGVVASVFKSWHWYSFVLLYIVFNQAMITNGQPFSLYLKAHADVYSPSEINNIPTGQSAVSIVAALGFCYWADATGVRWVPSLVICGCMVFGSVCMAVWYIPIGLKLFAFYVAGLGGALNPLFMSWASEVTVGSAEERTVVVASMNAFGQALLAGLNIVTFPTPEAPRFKFGWYWVMANNIVQIMVVIGIAYLHTREKRRDTQVFEGIEVDNGDDVEGVDAPSILKK
ncbi:hypothetical protein SLS54_008140 [Diplodia seriata]